MSFVSTKYISRVLVWESYTEPGRQAQDDLESRSDEKGMYKTKFVHCGALKMSLETLLKTSLGMSPIARAGKGNCVGLLPLLAAAFGPERMVSVGGMRGLYVAHHATRCNLRHGGVCLRVSFGQVCKRQGVLRSAEWRGKCGKRQLQTPAANAGRRSGFAAEPRWASCPHTPSFLAS